MNYIELEFDIPEDQHELFIAELLDLDFYGFEQFDQKLVAYIESPRYNDSTREAIEQIISIFEGASFRESLPIEEKNWNEIWEESIKPQRIGQFLVKPTWSNEMTKEGEILLEIDPKLAFGTGYHATTRLILQQLTKLNFHQKTVLDAGTGTGILAIASIKLGASAVIGFDMDPWSEVNAKENAIINFVDDRVEIRFGGPETIKENESFDIILANINRNAILEMIPFFVQKTVNNGTILLTGLLDSDEAIIRERLSNEPVNVTDFQQEGEWILFQLQKGST